jgi:hypothetical protein
LPGNGISLLGVGKIVPFQQTELLVVWGIVGHYAELAAVMHHLLAGDILDDRRIAAGILQGHIHRRLAAMRLHHHQLHAVEQCQSLGDGCCSVQQVLRPKASLQRGLGWVTRPEIGGWQV